MPRGAKTVYSKELTIMKTAIINEHEGHQFYLLAAEKLPDGDVKNIFLALAQEEVKHEKWLKDLYVNLMHNKKPPGELSPLPGDPGSPGIFRKENLKNAGSLEVSALHIGVLMEMASADYYRTAARHTEIPAIRELYQLLTDWEMNHLRKLEEAYDFARDEWWDRQGFSPA